MHQKLLRDLPASIQTRREWAREPVCVAQNSWAYSVAARAQEGWIQTIYENSEGDDKIPLIRRRRSWGKWSSSRTSVSCHPHLLFTSSRVHKMEFRSQDQGARLRQNTIDKETLVLGEMVIEPNVRVMSPSLAVHEFTSSENGVQIARSGAKLRQNKLTKSRPFAVFVFVGRPSSSLSQSGSELLDSPNLNDHHN